MDDVCRIVAVDLSTGDVLDGPRDFAGPATARCKHGGGIAIHEGKVWLADTHALFAFDPNKLFSKGQPLVIKLNGLNGPFVTDHGANRLNVGSNDKGGPDNLLYEFTVDTCSTTLAVLWVRPMPSLPSSPTILKAPP